MVVVNPIRCTWVVWGISGVIRAVAWVVLRIVRVVLRIVGVIWPVNRVVYLRIQTAAKEHAQQEG